MHLGTPLKQLGVRSDGWSDIIENDAELVDRVKQAFLDEINAQGLPGVRVTDVNLTSDSMETRPYQMVSDNRGTTIAVRIAPFGKNLFVGWDLYTRREINWLTVGLLAGIVLVLAVLDVILTSLNYGPLGFFHNFFTTLGAFISWLLVPGLVILLLGKILKDDWLAFYVKNMDEFAVDDAVSLSTIVDNLLTRAVEKSQSAPAKLKK
jgi:uncharacterized membrane protein